MVDVLHKTDATPSQIASANAHREREQRIAARAKKPDAPNAPDLPAAPPPLREPSPGPLPYLPFEDYAKSELAKRQPWFWIEKEIEPALRRKLSAEDIQRAVARHCKISVADMISAKRTADIVRPRQVAMFIARNLLGLSYPAIARKFGGKDHTTVLHGVRKIVDQLRCCDVELAADLDAIGQALAKRFAQ